MNLEKEKYLDNIRKNTAYPTYRGIIGLITLIPKVNRQIRSGGSKLLYSFFGPLTAEEVNDFK